LPDFALNNGTPSTRDFLQIRVQTRAIGRRLGLPRVVLDSVAVGRLSGEDA
jgi:hypothetical protein